MKNCEIIYLQHCEILFFDTDPKDKNLLVAKKFGMSQCLLFHWNSMMTSVNLILNVNFN